MKLLLISTVLLAASSVIAQPQLNITSGEVIDWGSVKPGILTRDIVIENSGNEILKITDVFPGCDCTTAPVDDTALAPGKSTVIRVRVDFTRSNGPQSKPLQIVTNDPKHPKTMINLRAYVEQDLQVSPKEFPYYGGVATGKEFSTNVTIKNLRDKAFVLNPPSLSGDAPIEVRFTPNAPLTLNPGDSATITAYVTPHAPGVHMASAKVTSNSPYSPEIDIPLYLSVKENEVLTK